MYNGQITRGVSVDWRGRMEQRARARCAKLHHGHDVINNAGVQDFRYFSFWSIMSVGSQDWPYLFVLFERF